MSGDTTHNNLIEKWSKRELRKTIGNENPFREEIAKATSI